MCWSTQDSTRRYPQDEMALAPSGRIVFLASGPQNYVEPAADDDRTVIVWGHTHDAQNPDSHTEHLSLHQWLLQGN